MTGNGNNIWKDNGEEQLERKPKTKWRESDEKIWEYIV